MELIQGCRNKVEQEKVQRELATYGVVWPAPADCDDALEVFTTILKPGNRELILGLYWRMVYRSVSKYKTALYPVPVSPS